MVECSGGGCVGVVVVVAVVQWWCGVVVAVVQRWCGVVVIMMGW